MARDGPAAGGHSVKHFDDLDLLRGVAALCVVVFHCHTLGILPAVLPHGYLAVDFFFALSGFVIAFAYREPLQAGLGLGAFAVRRFVRIYPVALAGVASGAVVLWLQWLRNPSVNISPSGIGTAALFNLALLPDPFGGGFVRETLYPCDVVIWSLFFELAVNLAWAAGVWRAPTAGLAALWACGGAWFALTAAAHGDADMGVDWPTFSGALARVCLGFCAGLLLERFRDRPGPRLASRFPRVPAPLLAAALVSTLAVPALGAAKPWWDVVAVAGVFPAILLFGMSRRNPSRVSRAFGDLSYPLYALHVPVLKTVKFFGVPLRGAFGDGGFTALCIAATVLVAWGASVAYEAPVRRWLAAKLRERRAISRSPIQAA